jgi:hypothetical protein
MKKTNLLFLAGIAALGILATSCGKNEDPAIVLASTSTAEGATVVVGDSIIYDVEVSDDKEVKEVSIAIKGGTTAIKTVSVGAKTGKAHFAIVAETEGTASYTITVVDKKDAKLTKDVSCIVDKGFNVYTTLLMSNQKGVSATDASQKSFLNATEGKVIGSLLDAAAVSNKIDVIYVLRNNTNVAPKGRGRILCCAVDENSVDVYSADPSNASRVEKWGTRNKTLFAKVTVADWATIKLSDINFKVTTASATYVDEIKSGDIVTFKTASGKNALAKIVTATGTDTYSADGVDNDFGTITLEVKIAK